MVLGAHRKDAACINSLAALLSSCFAKLLHGRQGGYASIHARGNAPAAPELITSAFLCEALLFPVIKSTFRYVVRCAAIVQCKLQSTAGHAPTLSMQSPTCNRL